MTKSFWNFSGCNDGSWRRTWKSKSSLLMITKGYWVGIIVPFHPLLAQLRYFKRKGPYFNCISLYLGKTGGNSSQKQGHARKALRWDRCWFLTSFIQLSFIESCLLILDTRIEQNIISMHLSPDPTPPASAQRHHVSSQRHHVPSHQVHKGQCLSTVARLHTAVLMRRVISQPPTTAIYKGCSCPFIAYSGPILGSQNAKVWDVYSNTRRSIDSSMLLDEQQKILGTYKENVLGNRNGLRGIRSLKNKSWMCSCKTLKRK